MGSSFRRDTRVPNRHRIKLLQQTRDKPTAIFHRTAHIRDGREFGLQNRQHFPDGLSRSKLLPNNAASVFFAREGVAATPPYPNRTCRTIFCSVHIHDETSRATVLISISRRLEILSQTDLRVRLGAEIPRGIESPSALHRAASRSCDRPTKEFADRQHALTTQ